MVEAQPCGPASVLFIVLRVRSWNALVAAMTGRAARQLAAARRRKPEDVLVVFIVVPGVVCQTCLVSVRTPVYYCHFGVWRPGWLTFNCQMQTENCFCAWPC